MTTPTLSPAGPRSRRVRVACGVGLVAVLVLVPLVFAFQLARVGPRPQGLELGVVGPVLVSQSVVERAAGLPGDALDAVVLPEEADPADAVRTGRLDATLEIDLLRSYDVLRVSSTTDPDLVAEVRAQVASVSRGYDRDVRVVEVDPVRNPGAWRGLPYAMTVAWIVLGTALAVGLSLVAGPLAATTRRALVRVLVLAGASVLAALAVTVTVGLVGDAEVGLLRTTAVGACAVAGTAWLVRGAEALFGLAGLGVAVSFVLAGVVPLLALTDEAVLPPPWPDVVPWTGPGAALALTRADVFFGASVGARPIAVLVSWVLLALLTLGAAMRAGGSSTDRAITNPHPRASNLA